MRLSTPGGTVKEALADLWCARFGCDDDMCIPVAAMPENDDELSRRDRPEGRKV